MENSVKIQVIRTTLTGKIDGKEVTINYENKMGEHPANVNASCTIADTANPMLNSIINVSINRTGNKNIQVSGKVGAGEIQVLLVGIESEIESVLTDTEI